MKCKIVIEFQNDHQNIGSLAKIARGDTLWHHLLTNQKYQLFKKNSFVNCETFSHFISLKQFFAKKLKYLENVLSLIVLKTVNWKPICPPKDIDPVTFRFLFTNSLFINLT